MANEPMDARPVQRVVRRASGGMLPPVPPKPEDDSHADARPVRVERMG